MACMAAFAQVPDVQVHLDARLNYRTLDSGANLIRWYDTLGRRSMIELVFTLEPGFKAVVTQRLERIPNDGDPDQVDEYYIEDEGNWRIGKQVLPFGAQFLNRESVLAARTDTSFFLAHLPLKIAVCDAGPGRERGVVGRFGSRLGVSVEAGYHFGIASTSLEVLRRPEGALGLGRGYRQIYGLDYSEKHGLITSSIEMVAVRNGMTGERNETVLDLSVALEPDRYHAVTLGFTKAFDQPAYVIRLLGSFYAYRGATIEPVLRFKDGRVFDFGLSARYRL
jgi:hypothetical protein